MGSWQLTRWGLIGGHRVARRKWEPGESAGPSTVVVPFRLPAGRIGDEDRVCLLGGIRGVPIRVTAELASTPARLGADTRVDASVWLESRSAWMAVLG